MIINRNILPALKVDKEKILIFNMCAFDSLLVTITVRYIDNKRYKLYIDNNKMNHFIRQ
jgi:hypothetical protein